MTDLQPSPVASRWEVGSSFPLHQATGAEWAGPPPPAAPPYGELFGSGRQALRALVEFGRREYGWTALHLPTYYCDEVTDAVTDVLPVRRYPAGPDGGVPPVVAPTDAVVLVSYFGAPPVVPAPAGATLIVDVTHDPRAPWLPSLRADYVFASLRKTLPLPDGGALWSDSGRPLPSAGPPTARHLAVVDRVLAAMCLKAAYLAGAPLDKQRYLARYAAGEDLLRTADVSGISEFSRQALHALPVDRLRLRRIENAALLAAGLAGLPGLTARAWPLGVVLEFGSHRSREAVRHGLIERSVYPAVLWRLVEPDENDDQVRYSRRMLFLHTDHRFRGSDMARVAELVRALHPPGAEVVPDPAPPGPVSVPRGERC
ncbi:hypothetical protein ACIBF5_12495 [Micromonospora sp. NPDC050417]|uniref:hypothetical protein n=1 Tax=Micromonospora sp. NPDC050417 TaxID=3364280 RepID=UPI0037914CB1